MWGFCSILIPFPHATDDHQFENAKILERIGAAEIVLHHQFTPEFMAEKLVSTPAISKREIQCQLRNLSLKITLQSVFLMNAWE